MFDVGFAEIFLLGLIGLLVLGPERLPAVARTVGGFMRKARASWASLRSTIESELAEADIAAPIKEAGEELKRIGKDLKSDLPDMNKILDGTPTSPEESAADSTANDNKIEDIAATPDDSAGDNAEQDNPGQPGHLSK